MSCFLVPLAQAVATTCARKLSKKSGSNRHSAWVENLPKLELMLWGGSLMLIVDHILNGEVTYRYPFFTALESEGGGYTMLHEMLTTGLLMSAAITLTYTVMVALRTLDRKVD